MTTRPQSVLVVLAVWLLAFPTSAWAEDGGLLAGYARNDGIRSQATAAQVDGLATGKDLGGNTLTQPMEFTTRLACQAAAVGAAPVTACQKAALGCIQDGQQTGIGLLYEILARPRGSTAAWQHIGNTCFADHVPGASPALTMAMIRDAFHNTPWATATISTQPHGNVTLVGLATYVKVVWSETGYQPGEVDTLDPARMLGMRVEIRPEVDHFTYVFGDGQTFGPTRSEGGVWPTGDIIHTYTTPGTYAVRVDTTFTGDFRVNGGPWTRIADTVTIRGPATDVQVKTARPVLVR